MWVFVHIFKGEELYMEKVKPIQEKLNFNNIVFFPQNSIVHTVLEFRGGPILVWHAYIWINNLVSNIGWHLQLFWSSWVQGATLCGAWLHWSAAIHFGLQWPSVGRTHTLCGYKSLEWADLQTHTASYLLGPIFCRECIWTYDAFQVLQQHNKLVSNLCKLIYQSKMKNKTKIQKKKRRKKPWKKLSLQEVQYVYAINICFNILGLLVFFWLYISITNPNSAHQGFGPCKVLLTRSCTW